MRIKEHRLIAGFISGSLGGFKNRLCFHAFMLGSILPDLGGQGMFNPLQYTLRSYDGLSAKDKKDWTVSDYFRAGRIIHNVSESFTGMHKAYSIFMPYDKFVYNRMLGRVMHEYINDCKQPEGNPAEVGADYICRCHITYIRNSTDAYDDCRWIVTMTSAAAKGLAGEGKKSA